MSGTLIISSRSRRSRSYYDYHLVLVIICLAAGFCCSARAQDEGKGPLPEPIDKYFGTASSYIDQQKEQMKKDNTEEIVKANVEKWGKGTVKPVRHQGVDAKVVKETIESDTKFAIANFDGCQAPENPHKAKIMLNPVRAVVPIPFVCGIYYHYPGPSIGSCWYCVVAFPCGCFCTGGDLVEYRYPAYKVDVSDQMFSSLYIDKEDVVGKPGIAGVGGKMGMIASNKAWEEGQILGEMKDGKFNPGSEQLTLRIMQQKSESGKVNIELEDQGVDQLIGLNYQQVKAYREQHPDQVFGATAYSEQYARDLAEILNVATTYYPWFPHVAKRHHYMTDAGVGFLPARFLPFSAMMKGRWLQFMQKNGERKCIANNIASGKSPAGIDGITEEEVDGSNACMRNIGEVFPFTHTRRYHNTDATFAGAMKVIELYQSQQSIVSGLLGPLVGAHTFRKDLDQWAVMRGETFKKENPGCLPVEKMAKVNIDYKESNKIKAGEGFNNTFEIYPVFKGCWGMRGMDERTIEAASCWGQINDKGPSVFRPGELRLE